MTSQVTVGIRVALAFATAVTAVQAVLLLGRQIPLGIAAFGGLLAFFAVVALVCASHVSIDLWMTSHAKGLWRLTLESALAFLFGVVVIVALKSAWRAADLGGLTLGIAREPLAHFLGTLDASVLISFAYVTLALVYVYFAAWSRSSYAQAHL